MEDFKPAVISDETEEINALAPWSNPSLKEESLALLSKIIESQDVQETQDLTQLFNINQNKKTLIRIDKLSDLQDGLVDQFVKRIAERPDEISNKELMDGLRIVQDIIERGQKQAAGADTPGPMIQINQQNNIIEASGTQDLNRESRERVKNAVLSLLSGLTTPPASQDIVVEDTSDVEDK